MKDTEKYFYLKFKDMNKDQQDQALLYLKSPCFKGSDIEGLLRKNYDFQFVKETGLIRGMIMY